MKKKFIGVHAGYSPVDGLNYGTLLRKSLQKWIEQAEDDKKEPAGCNLM